MKTVFCFILFSLISLTGCMVPNQMGKTFNNAINQHSDYLRVAYGPPTHIIDNGNVGTIWEYIGNTITKTTPGFIAPIGRAYIYNTPTYSSYQQYFVFWVSKNNIVYKGESKGYNLKKVSPTFYVSVIVAGLLGVAIYNAANE